MPLDDTSSAPDPAPVVDPQTALRDRATATYQGLRDRGMDYPTALGVTANAIVETKANPQSERSSSGAAGTFQWVGPRLTAYAALHGHAPEDGDLDEHLDHLVWENQNLEKPAWNAVQNAAPDPVSKATTFRTAWERPGRTPEEVTAEANKAAGAARWLMSFIAPSAEAAEPTQQQGPPPALAGSIAAARKAGYDDATIFGAISQSPKWSGNVAAALRAGHAPGDVAGFMGLKLPQQQPAPDANVPGERGPQYLPPGADVSYHRNPLPEAPTDEGNYAPKTSTASPEDQADLRLSGELGAPMATTPGVAHAPTMVDKLAAKITAPASDPSELIVPPQAKNDDAGMTRTTAVDEYGNPLNGPALPDVTRPPALPVGDQRNGAAFQRPVTQVDLAQPQPTPEQRASGLLSPQAPQTEQEAASGLVNLQEPRANQTMETVVPGQGVVGAAVQKFRQGVEVSLGQAVSAVPRIAEGANILLRSNQMGAITAIDAGKPVPQDQDPAGYQFMSPDQRAQFKAQLAATAAQAGASTADNLTRNAVENAQRVAAVSTALENSPAVKMAGSVGGFAPIVLGTMVGGLPGITGAAALQNYEGMFERARQAGAAPEVAHRVAVQSALAEAALMTIPAQQYFGRFVPGLQVPVIGAVLDTALASGTMVGVSQLQTLADNAIAKYNYDPAQSLTEGVGNPEDMTAQALIGAALHAAPRTTAAMGRAVSGAAQNLSDMRATIAAARQFGDPQYASALTDFYNTFNQPDATSPHTPGNAFAWQHDYYPQHDVNPTLAIAGPESARAPSPEAAAAPPEPAPPPNPTGPAHDLALTELERIAAGRPAQPTPIPPAENPGIGELERIAAGQPSASQAPLASEPSPIPLANETSEPPSPPEMPGATAYAPEPKEPMRLIPFLRQGVKVNPGTPQERIAQFGVTDPGGSIASIVGGPKGRPGLINNANGESLDRAGERAFQAGYFPQGRPDLNELRQAIEEDHGGNPVYSMHDQDAVAAYQQAITHNDEIDRLSSQYGLPTRGLTRDQFFDQITDQMSMEDAAKEHATATAAHQDAFDKAVASARQSGVDPEAYTPRSLQEMEDEYRQADNAQTAGYSGANDVGRSPARGNASPGQNGAGPGGRGAGSVGRGGAESGASAVDQAAEYRDELPGEGLFAGRPLPSAGEVITKGDLWKLPREELESMRDDESFSDHAKLVRALGGEDAAKEFNRLDRKQNSSNPDRADEGAREFDAKFGNLTPEQEQLIYGTGEIGPSVDDIEDVLKAHHTRSDNPEDAAYEAALAMRHVTPAQMMEVPTGRASSTAQAAYVRLRNAYEDMANAGLDSRQIESNILGALIRRGWKEADAREVIGGFIDQMRKLSQTSKNRLEAGRRLPAPPPTGADLFGAARAQTAARTPEPTIRTDTRQQTLEGMEPSARQAQAASDARGPRAGQKSTNEGLFATPETVQPGLAPSPHVMDFESYAARQGASKFDYGDAALHRSSEHESARSFKANRANQLVKDRELVARRAALSKEYDAEVAAGRVRPPTKREQLEQIAAGHSDNESVQAARRMLAKMDSAAKGESLSPAKPPMSDATWNALLAKGARQKAQAAIYAEHAKPVRFQSKDGSTSLVSKDLNHAPDGWRLTHFGKDGQPTGHLEFKNPQDAFLYAVQRGEELRTSRWPQPNFRDLLNEIPATGHQVAADWVFNQGRATGHEHIAVVNNRTGEIVHAGTSGEEGRVDFPGDNGAKDTDSYTLHHNHPNSTAVSRGDVSMLANPKISHIVSHGHDGTTSVVSLTPTIAARMTPDKIGLNTTVLRNFRSMSDDQSRAVLQKLLDEGKISYNHADQAMDDVANRLLHAEGILDYASTLELDPAIKDALAPILKRLGHATPEIHDRYTLAVAPEERIGGLPAPHAGDAGTEPAGGPGRNQNSPEISGKKGADTESHGVAASEGSVPEKGLSAGQDRTPEQRAAILHNLRNGPLPPREMPNLIDQGPPRPPREPKAATPRDEGALPLSEPPQPDNTPHGNEPPPPDSLWGNRDEPPAEPPRPPEIEAARITRPQAVKNLNVVENLTIMPQTLATLDEPSARLWNSWQNRARDETINAGQLRHVITPNFLKLSKAERLHVAGALEIARVEGEENLFANPDGTITAQNNAISFARWSKVGDALHLTPQETVAYHEAVQLGKDQWTMLMKGAARRYGWGGDIDPAVIREAANQHGDPGDYKKLNRLADLLDVMRQHEQDVYFPMQRFGSYFIAIRPKTGPGVVENLGGHPPLAWFETVEKPAFQDLFGVTSGRLSVQNVAAKRIAELQKQFPPDKFDVRQGDFARTPGLLRQINIPAVEKLFMLMENKVKSAVQDQIMRGDNPPTTKSGVREEARNRYDELHGSTLEAFYDALFEELKSGYRRKANVVPGYSADFDRAVSSHLYQIARNSADMVHRDGIESAYQNIQDFHPHDNVKKYWKNWRAYQENPGSALGRAAATMNQIGFTYMLGMNPSSTMIIASHMPMTAAPVLSVGVGSHVAVPAMIRGLKNAYGSLRFDSVHGAHIDLDKAMAGMSPEKQAFLRLMASEGRLAAVGTHDMAALNDKMAALFRGYADTARRGMEIATSNVHAVDQANRFAVASAAWDIASNPTHFNAAAAPLMRHNAIFRDMVQREIGLSRESYGRFMLSKAAFDWGKESHAPLMRGPLGQLMFALHGFQTRYLSTAFNLMKNGGPEGKFGFGLMMAALGLGAGALGLPFSEDAMNGADTVWHHFTGHDPDIKHKIEDAIQDTGMGQIGADMILHGPLSVATGVNLGSRIGFGDVLSREFESSNVLGTIPSIAWSAYNGASQRAVSNQPTAAIAAEAAPAMLRGPLRAYAETQQGVTSRRGVQQIPSENIGGADLAKTALGFQPLAVMRRQDEKNREYKAGNSQEAWISMIKSGDSEDAIKEMVAAGWSPGRVKAFIRENLRPIGPDRQFQRFEQNRGVAPPP